MGHLFSWGPGPQCFCMVRGINIVSTFKLIQSLILLNTEQLKTVIEIVWHMKIQYLFILEYHLPCL